MGEQRDAAERPPDRSFRRRKVAVAVALVLVALVIGATMLRDGGRDGADDRDAKERPESSAGFQYASELRVDVGERALAVNDDDIPHTYTSDDGLFDSGVLDAGAEARLPSLAEGSYPYHCEIHPALRGELVVSEG